MHAQYKYLAVENVGSIVEVILEHILERIVKLILERILKTFWFRRQVLTIVVIDFLFFFLSLFLLHFLLLTHFKETPEAEICFSPYSGITRRNMKKEKKW